METRSKKKVVIATEYEKMCKVRVPLQRLNVDLFLKTGQIIFSNEKRSDNVHVSIFYFLIKIKS